jgi:predicted phosphodiesterase
MADGQILKGPYLLYQNSPDSIAVMWQTDSTYECLIEWGLDDTVFDNQSVSTEIDTGLYGHRHKFMITGLIPETKYFYQVHADSAINKGSFRTAPEFIPEVFTFFAIGDPQIYPEVTDSVTEQMNQHIFEEEANQTLVALCGDWTVDDSEDSWQNIFFNRNYINNLTLHANMPIIGARGNHDYLAEQLNKYWPLPVHPEGNYYSMDYGPVHFSIIDQYVDYSPGSDQYNWLVNDLSSTDKTIKIIILHEPGYTVETVHLPNTYVQEYIQPLCIDFEVKLVLGGHNHLYARCEADGITHLTLGGANGYLYTDTKVGPGLIISEMTNHFAKITVSYDMVYVEAIRPDNTIIDSFSVQYQPVMGNKNIDTKRRIQIKEVEKDIFQIQHFPDTKNKSVEIDLNIINAEGRVVYSNQYLSFVDDKIHIPKKGIYIVNISIDNTSTVIKKFINF